MYFSLKFTRWQSSRLQRRKTAESNSKISNYELELFRIVRSTKWNWSKTVSKQFWNWFFFSFISFRCADSFTVLV